MIVFRPDYQKFGRLAAFLARNTEIIEKSDVIFAFWDGKSRGTMDSINKTKKLKKQLFIIVIKKSRNYYSLILSLI